MKTFNSHGKLLLTGEYVVLDGANALAIPTKLGQNLIAKENDSQRIKWTSIDHNNKVWYQAEFELSDNTIFVIKQDKQEVTDRLLQILQAVRQLNPEFFIGKGYDISTNLEFPKNWGLGTSSTLINNIANWSNVDAYELLELTFGGSGYDIACADSNSALTYQLLNNNSNSPISNNRLINTVDFNPSFKDNLYFVYLNQKQNSREGITQYKANRRNISEVISRINDITNAIISCDSLVEFQRLIDTHENIISSIIKQTPANQRLFSDFNGSIKSLGAWGGDFILAACEQNPVTYFSSKGYHTVIEYNTIVLH